MVSAKNAKVAEYWRTFYVAPSGLCAICGNSGVVDTSRTKSPVGEPVRLATIFCFCPNGQMLRHSHNQPNPPLPS